jgi:PAS domain S-box-containing protein
VTRRQTTLPTLGLAVALATVGAVATLAYRHLSKLTERARGVAHTHEVLQSAGALEAALERAQAARRAFALTGDERQLEPYRGALEEVVVSRDALRRLTADDLAQQRRMDDLEPMVATRLARLENAISQRKSLGFDVTREAALTTEGEKLNHRLSGLLTEIEAAEQGLLEQRETEYGADAAMLRQIMVAGFAASAIILLLAFLALRREAVRREQSEHRLAIIVNSIGDAVIATDEAGRVTHMNPVAEQLTGWSAREAAGRPFADVFRITHQKTRQPEPDPVARVLAERVQIGLANHTVLVARDGSERPIADSAAPILDAHGGLHGVVLVCRDVSETYASEARFRHLVEAAPDAILITDPQGRIAIVNDQVTALFGYSAPELVGQPVEVLLPAHLRGLHQEHRQAFDAAPAVRAMGAGLPLVGRRKDGTEVPIEVSLSPLRTPEGAQVIAAVRDVTRRRDLERFRDEYVGYISHDLRNPLSIIVLQARHLARLLDARASAEEKQALRVIAENAGFIDHLVRELLEMAYAESEHLQLQLEPVALAPLLEAIVERTVSSSDRARVRLEILERPSASVESRRIERVVVNFLQNAVKYSPPASPIVVRLTASADQVVLSVIDQGAGIDPRERSFVFDKYRRAASARGKEGLGIGLYVSRKIVEAHGGQIGVESGDDGRGARFFVTLMRIADLAEAAAPVAPSPTSPGSRGLKVLLVDDEVNAVSALVSLLRDEGLQVSGATSGERALELAEGARPDVAVVDVQMPGMSGLELLERLRSRYPGLPAVIMTGFLGNHPGVAEARAEAGTAYVGKPVDVDELLRTLERMIPGDPAA